MSYARASLGRMSSGRRRARRRASALGFFLIDDLAAVAGAVKGITSITSAISGMFSGSTDQQRQARADFYGNSTLAGSVTAGRYVLGGLANTASHESPMYQAWITKLENDPFGNQVLAEARAQGALWPANDTGPQSAGTQAAVQAVQQDLAAIGKAAPVGSTSFTSGGSSSGTPTTTRPVALPPMQTTAPFNYTPWLIAGGAVVAIVLIRGRS